METLTFISLKYRLHAALQVRFNFCTSNSKNSNPAVHSKISRREYWGHVISINIKVWWRSLWPGGLFFQSCFNSDCCVCPLCRYSMSLPLIWARCNRLIASHYNGNFEGRHLDATLLFPFTALQQKPPCLLVPKDAAANNSQLMSGVQHPEMLSIHPPTC